MFINHWHFPDLTIVTPVFLAYHINSVFKGLNAATMIIPRTINKQSCHCTSPKSSMVSHLQNTMKYLSVVLHCLVPV